MKNELIESFKKDLLRLVGKDCWGIAAGSGTGSVISLSLGDKIPLDVPVDNDCLTEVIRNNDSEFCLFIKCIWRIDSPSKVVCGGWDDNSVGEKMLGGLNFLIDFKISEILVCEPALDLKITFSNDLKLSIFCDQTNEEDRYDNYDYFTPEIIYTVGHNSSLETSEHDK